jgi:hypothetical protein
LTSIPHPASPQAGAALLRELIAAVDGAYSSASNRWVPAKGTPEYQRLPKRLREQADTVDRESADIFSPMLERIGTIRAELARLSQIAPSAERTERLLRLRDEWGAIVYEALEWMWAHRDNAYDLVPDNPVGVLNTGQQPPEVYGQWFHTGRLYLDVTDAKWEHVRELWAVVEAEQAALRAQGKSTKRGRGNTRGPRKPEVRTLVERAKEIGRDEARSEYLARFPSAHGYRRDRAEWWRKTIDPHLG